MNGHDVFRFSAVGAFALCYVTIILGGNVMASDSGLACPDWPTCHGSLLPPLAGPTGIEWAHRIAAALLSLAVVFLAAAALRYESNRPVLRRMAVGALALVVAQGLLGGLVVTSELVVGVVLLHFFLATLLFALLLLLTAVANLRQMPRRWIDWAWRAGVERAPGAHRKAPAPAGEPGFPRGAPDPEAL